MFRQIIFTEPSTYNSKNPYVKQKKIRVTENFYKTLQKRPKILKSNEGNAYVFGKKFNVKVYKKIRSHGNDGAQTGFIDAKLWKDGIYNAKAQEVNEKFDYSYDKPANVAAIKKLTNGAIIFQGETIGGDVGADLYAHYDASGNIDSLIIDNNYCFPHRS